MFKMGLSAKLAVAYTEVLSVTLPLADRLFQFSPMDDLNDLMDDLTSDAGATNTYESVFLALKALWVFLKYPFTVGHAGTSVAWNGINGGVLTMTSALMTFSVMMAIFVFYWGLSKANIQLDRHDSWKNVLGRVLQLVIVIVLMNNIFDIVSWLQDVASAFFDYITRNTTGDDVITNLVTSISSSTSDAWTDWGLGDDSINNFLAKAVSFFGMIAVTIGIAKKIIDVIKQCIPTIIEIYVYTWFFPVGLAWLASPEGKQKFMSYIGGYAQALFTNVMRVACFIFLGTMAQQSVTLPVGSGGTTLHVFQISEMALTFIGEGYDNWFVHSIIYGQRQGINMLFILGILELLMRGSEKIAAKVFS